MVGQSICHRRTNADSAKIRVLDVIARGVGTEFVICILRYPSEAGDEQLGDVDMDEFDVVSNLAAGAVAQYNAECFASSAKPRAASYSLHLVR